MLRGRPSYEKLYLLSGPAGWRVITGSANLSLAAFEGRQQEVYVAFDGDAAWTLFDDYYQRDWRDGLPVEPDPLLVRRTDGASAACDAPLELEEVPIVRVLRAGVALVDDAPRPAPPSLAADALQSATALGAELKDLALPKDRAGRTVVNAAAVLRVIRGFRSGPLAEATEDVSRAPRSTLSPGWCGWTVRLGYGPTIPSLGTRSRATPASSSAMGRARSMFGFEKMISSGQFTANRGI